MYTILHLDPHPDAAWKIIEEKYLHNAIGVRFSPWPEHRLDEREEKITAEIRRLARMGEVYTHPSGDKYRVLSGPWIYFYHPSSRAVAKVNHPALIIPMEKIGFQVTSYRHYLTAKKAASKANAIEISHIGR